MRTGRPNTQVQTTSTGTKARLHLNLVSFTFSIFSLMSRQTFKSLFSALSTLITNLYAEQRANISFSFKLTWNSCWGSLSTMKSETAAKNSRLQHTSVCCTSGEEQDLEIFFPPRIHRLPPSGSDRQWVSCPRFLTGSSEESEKAPVVHKKMRSGLDLDC